MYQRYNSGASQHSQRGFGQRRSFGGSRPSFGGRRGQQPSFDPSHLVKKAEVLPPQPVYQPQHNFADFGLDQRIVENVLARGYNAATPIQDQAIPVILQGKDVVGVANTGTGKTAAFLLPLIDKVVKDKEQGVLIVLPTRELAVQVRDELQLFSRGLSISSVLCIGGVSMYRQIENLRRRPQFVIATLGRLVDLEHQRAIDFADYSSIVLDEVDRMLDMGFITDVKYMVQRLPQPRHSLFFSATMTDKVKSIMNSFAHQPEFIEIKSARTSANVDQDIIRLNGRSKVDVLHDLLLQDGFDKVLVFGKTKHGMEKLARDLHHRGLQVAAIHGNKSQGQRQRALQEFKDNRVQVLLATDVVARGVDVDNISHVINFDLPQTYEDYIHRIGRTGRANKTGVALTLVD